MNPAPTLCLVPADVHSALLRGRSGPHSGVVVAAGRPHPRPYALHRDVLAAFGARDDVRGATARAGAGRELTLIGAWAGAWRVGTVVVAHADMVTAPAWFGPLRDALAAHGVRLVLVCDDESVHGASAVADWVESAGGTVTGPASLPTAKANPDRDAGPCAHAFPVVLPRVAFYLFRTACRDSLLPAQFAVVDDVYRAEFARFVAMPDPTPDAIREALVSTFGTCETPAEVIPVVRAAQAAMFTRGLLLGVRLEPAMSAIRDRLQRPLSDPEIQALCAYREPWIGVATVMRHMDLEYNNMANMRLRNVDEDGRYTAKGLTKTMPDTSHVFFRAQRLVRLAEGAGPDDRFLPQPPRTVADAIRWTKSDLNLPGLPPNKRRGDRSWDDRMKVTLRKLSSRPHRGTA